MLGGNLRMRNPQFLVSLEIRSLIVLIPVHEMSVFLIKVVRPHRDQFVNYQSI